MYFENLKKFTAEKSLLWIFCLLPVSIMLGSFILNINLVIFDLLVIYILFRYKNINIFYKYKFFFLVLAILLTSNIIISNNLELSIKGIAGLIKNLIFLFGIAFIIKYKELKNFFSPIVIICLIFVTLNIFLQFFFTEDLFGNKIVGSLRSTAVFGDQIPGSYLLKFFFIGLIFFKFQKNLILNIIYFAFFSSFIILTNERMSIINITIFSVLFFLIFPKENIIKKTSAILILILVWSLVFVIPTQNAQINNYEGNLYKQLITRSQNQLNSQLNGNMNNFLDIHWFQHFRAASEMFVKKPILGSGIKTFRFQCPENQKNKSNDEKFLCSTHPHNIYFEIISEVGLFGLILFLISISYILKKILYIYIKFKEIRYSTLVVLFPILTMFNPIQFTGAFFSTYSGFFYFMILGVALNYIKYNSSLRL